MIRTYVLPILALCGLVFAIHSVVTASKPVPVAQPVVEPAQAPFQSFIAGAGLVEARTQNVAVGTPVPGIVTAVFVQVGSTVRAGEPLFTLDDRELQAELTVRRTALHTAQEQLSRLQHWPRAEDFPPAEARVKEAEAALADARAQLAMAESVSDRRAVSQEEVSRRRFAVQGAEARLAAARAQVALLKAGTWKQDVNVARAEAAAAQAQVQAIETHLARLTVRAPMDGELLQVNIRPGEFAPTGVLQTPLMLLGNLSRLHVRVDVDENDAWRFQPQAAAVAFVRGNRDLQTPLRFERVEPYIVPKRALTGESTERVDTRVLQILYSFERGAIPVYVGQQMDVFLETSALSPSAAAAPLSPDTLRGTP
ncbi:MAG: HlyD family secretion protein [Candidatus Tectimicrobiota bacterium]